MRERAHQQCLGDAGHAFDERVLSGEDGDERAIDYGALADDHFGHFVPRLVEDFFEPFGVGHKGALRYFRFSMRAISRYASTTFGFSWALKASTTARIFSRRGGVMRRSSCEDLCHSSKLVWRRFFGAMPRRNKFSNPADDSRPNTGAAPNVSRVSGKKLTELFQMNNAARASSAMAPPCRP